MYNFADLADEEGGTPWPEIEELMPMAIAAVKSVMSSHASSFSRAVDEGEHVRDIREEHLLKVLGAADNLREDLLVARGHDVVAAFKGLLLVVIYAASRARPYSCRTAGWV
jgi:hypothetical protein